MKKLVSLKVSDIEPDPEQPRKDFREDVLKELAESIKEQGLKTPISVRAHPNKRFGGPSYMIIAGERRWRAHQLAEIQMIDAILEEGSAVDPDAIFAHQLIENILFPVIFPSYPKSASLLQESDQSRSFWRPCCGFDQLYERSLHEGLHSRKKRLQSYLQEVGHEYGIIFQSLQRVHFCL